MIDIFFVLCWGFIIFGTVIVLFRYRNKYSRWIIAAMILGIVIASNFAVKLTQNMPALSETMTLTALNQKNEQSSDTEIFVYGIRTQDEEKILPLNIISGNWFERGEKTGWIRGDRKGPPPRLTEKISIKIPVGKSREMVFSNGDWRGMVQLTYGEFNQIIDCYSSEGLDYSFALPDSPDKLILKNLLYICGISLFLFVALAILSLLLVAAGFKNKHIFAMHGDKLCFVFFGIIMLFYMNDNAYALGFWNDEMHQIGFVSEKLSLNQIFQYRLYETSPPLFSLVFAIWYRLVPYGQRWLLLLPELAVCVGLYFTGLSGSLIKSKFVGVVSALVCATSMTLVIYAGHEIRSNAFMFMFSSIVLYYYIKRCKQSNNPSLSTIVLLGSTMLLLSFSHYFGVVFCASLFILDFFFFINKKIPFKCILSYIIMGIPVLIWFVVMLIFGPISRGELANYWPPIPRLSNIYGLVKFFVYDNKILLFLFALGAFAAVTVSVYQYLNRKKKKEPLNLLFVNIWTIFFVISAIYLYSTNASSSLFYNRYFLCLFPSVAILIAYAVYCILNVMVQNGQNIVKAKISYITVAIALTVFMIVDVYTTPYPLNQASLAQPFRECADYLNEQPDIYYPDVAVVTTFGPSVLNGWEYYITEKGKRDSFTVLSSYTHDGVIPADNPFTSVDDLLKYRKLYAVRLHGSVPPELIDAISVNYEITSENAQLGIVVFERKADIDSTNDIGL